MDTLNNNNSLNIFSSDGESSENDIKKTKKNFKKMGTKADDWFINHSDDLWYMWCIIKDYSEYTGLLDKMDYSKFAFFCFNNSTISTKNKFNFMYELNNN